jgi:hypothetical protein
MRGQTTKRIEDHFSIHFNLAEIANSKKSTAKKHLQERKSILQE